MAEDLAKSIVKAAKVLDYDDINPNRRYASVRYYPEPAPGNRHWRVNIGRKDLRLQKNTLGGVLNALAEENYHISHKEAEKWLAEAKAAKAQAADGNQNFSIEFFASRTSN